jgi:Glycosyl hydrolase catalytic core
MKRLITLISAVALVLAVSQGTALATNFGFAQAYTPDFNNAFGTGQDANFTNFVYGRASYERFFVSWDAFGTYNGSTCVRPASWADGAGNGIDQLIRAVAYTENNLHETPLVALTNDHGTSGANYAGTGGWVEANPTRGAWEYYCGIYEIEAALQAWGLLTASHPVYFETYNEPEWQVSAAQAANYYIMGTIATGNYPGGHTIAGTFSTGNAIWIGARGTDMHTYITRYIQNIQSGYSGAVPSWSIHDYDDINAFDGSGGSIRQYITSLRSLGEPTNDIWVTEASLNKNQVDCNSQNAGANAFRSIYYSGLVAHLFDYDWYYANPYVGANPAQAAGCWYSNLYNSGF